MIGKWISNPNSMGTSFGLVGPPGVGKTSLLKHGVSKAIDRPFCFYALGGASDISHLEGHSYTYEGATWGRISEMLMELFPFASKLPVGIPRREERLLLF